MLVDIYVYTFARNSEFPYSNKHKTQNELANCVTPNCVGLCGFVGFG